MNWRVFSIVMSLLAVSCKSRPVASLPDFASGEHVLIGDTAFEEACRELADSCTKASEFSRADLEESFTYGEMLAFAGDFYASPEEMWLEKKKFLRALGNNIAGNKELFRRELAAVALLERSAGAEYPTFDLQYLKNFPRYLSLAFDNDIHFGFNNMVGYVGYHSQALSLAIDAYRLRDSAPVQSQRKWHEAVFYNAFADHMLSDAFAAGHIRVPRTQIKKWVANKKYQKGYGGTLSKILHDRDGRMGPDSDGLWVRNAEGSRWAARVDGELYRDAATSRIAADMVVTAVRMSISELMVAYRKGLLPQQTFAATNLVPFPDNEKEKPFSVRFGQLPDADVRAIVSEASWYSKVPVFVGFNEARLRESLAALPEIMKTFREDVMATMQEDEMLVKRLPAAYLQAYEGIN